MNIDNRGSRRGGRHGVEEDASAIPSAAYNTIERVPTGIPGVDDLIEGGLPRGRIVLLSGPAGAGKTTFGFQFLHHGITTAEENGVFVSLEEEIADLYQEMRRYGWNLMEFVGEKKLSLIKSPIPVVVNTPLTIDSLMDRIHTAVVQVNAKRLVFDSLAALGLCYSDPVNLRRDVLRLCDLLRELGCTTLLTTEVPENDLHGAGFGIEQLVTQGMILLHVSQTYRAIEVRKMRGTRHDTNVHRLRMSDRGLLVSPGEHPF
ncbi:MAG: AAA family ATPase [Abitibacteriaceae bacterium]|nr:AAA family ATPase [Abditibacteriaceae bacterium]